MCVQSQLEDQNTRLTVLESKDNTPEDIAAAMAAMPDVPRDKSGLKAV